MAVAFDQGLTALEVAALARHAKAKVTLAIYAGLVDDGREKAAAKLVPRSFGQ